MSQKIKKLKDPGSAITHFIGMLMAMFSALPLLIRASDSPEKVHVISLAIFALSLILLYTASTVYHTFDLSDKINRRLKKFDHMMIFILIAGTYTPICLIALGGKTGITLLIAIWGMAVLGICLKAFWVYCPKWVSSVIYITMGWTCVLAFTPLMSALPLAAFGWLLAGGIIYTIGGLIYALKLPIFNQKHPNFGTHEIFHLFCLGGSICHFIFMYRFIAVMP
jgi:hemolysin III